MTREFIITSIFDRRWREFDLSDDDLLQLQNHIMQNPQSGDIIEGTGGLKKLRWTLPNKGKSGGVRILYIDLVFYEKTFLINCYSNSEKDNISDKEKAMYKSFVKEIGKGLK